MKLIEALQSIATSALPALSSTRPLPVQRAQVPAPAVLAGQGHAGAAAPAPAAAPVAAAAPAPAPATEDARLTMLNELAAKLRQDQADQLATPPRSHIQSTAAWIKGRMVDPTAGPIWHNLPNVLSAFSDQAVVQYIATQAPDLTETPAKGAWLASLVELLKAKG